MNHFCRRCPDMTRYQDIKEELIAIRELRDTPSGTLRITTTEHAADTVLWPRIGIFMQKYPDIHIEISIDYGLSDIVAERFDMGIRLGDEVAKDMIAVRIGPDIRFCAVASPDYLSARKRPYFPQALVQHRCINFRLLTYGGMYAWELSREKEAVRIRVDGQLTVNGLYQALTATRAGLGIGFIPYDVAQESLADGTLVAVLEEWMPTFPGFHLYYPDRQKSRAASLLIEALRFSGTE